MPKEKPLTINESVELTSCPVITNFRSKDVALGGQGAPLVPLGERFLFPSYDICLNLGGIANLAFHDLTTSGNVDVADKTRDVADKTREDVNKARDVTVGHDVIKGFDVCPCNMLLNHIVKTRCTATAGSPEFDVNGEGARSGRVDEELLNHLSQLGYYSLPAGPKSLGREWFDTEMMSILDGKTELSAEDLLRTAVEHICQQIATSIKQNITQRSPTVKLLVSGGGAHNRFLIERFKDRLHKDRPSSQAPITVETLEPVVVDFKEAIIFAFLGLRCLHGRVNVDRRVTGAGRDVVAGSIQYGAAGSGMREYNVI